MPSQEAGCSRAVRDHEILDGPIAMSYVIDLVDSSWTLLS